MTLDSAPLGRLAGLALAAILLPATAFAQDSDQDGVLDAADVFPCDPALAAIAYAPAQGVHGTIAVEDLWPFELADLDFNDLQLGFSYEYRLDAQGRVRQLRAVFNVLALGGNLTTGAGLRLPVAASTLASATLTVDGVSTTLTPSPLDDQLTLVLAESLRELFAGQSGPINSVASDPAISAPPMVLELVFATPVVLAPSAAPHDVYVMRTYDQGHEIHRPEFDGTARMNRALFGSGIDGSTASRRFVDVDGLPYMLVFPERVSYPRELEPIHGLFPNIVTFAASGGTLALDFYRNGVDASFAYAPTGGALPAPVLPVTAAPDRSCVPVIRSSCLATLQAGLSRGSGIYSVDLDGPGPDAAFDVYCDMVTDGGGFTLVERLVNGYHATTGAVNASLLPGRATHAKVTDAVLRALATSGQREVMITGSGTRYILRYDAAEWSTFSSVGSTNLLFDAKRSDGVWVNNTCNGHYNNRGVSSYSDRHGAPCPTVHAGSSRYFSTWHTYNYAGGVGGTYEVYVR